MGGGESKNTSYFGDPLDINGPGKDLLKITIEPQSLKAEPNIKPDYIWVHDYNFGRPIVIGESV